MIPTAPYVKRLGTDHTLCASADELKKAAACLGGAFIWNNTAEGHDFWSAICRRLRELADAVEAEARVNPDDWKPVDLGPLSMTVAYWLALYEPSYLDRVTTIAKRVAAIFSVAMGRYYIKASQKEQEAGYTHVRIYPKDFLDRHVPDIICAL